MAIETTEPEGTIPDWLLAFGPFLVIAAIIALAFATLSLVDIESISITGTGEVLVALTVIGFIAGILPVLLGMLWFPYFRRLSTPWVHAVLAFSAGILVYIAVEMTSEAIHFAGNASNPTLGGVVAVVGAAATIAVMELGSRWRKGRTRSAEGDGLTIAYLVAIGLGLHSIGEGLAIGTAFVSDQMGLVLLFTVGFIIHNVTEGPAVIAAIARERERPPLRHFGALGVLAGGGVIIGGWIGSLAYSPLVATAFFAIAAGAIVQVTWEMFGLVWTDVDALLDRRIVIGFVLGIFVLFFLEDVIVEGWMGLG